MDQYMMLKLILKQDTLNLHDQCYVYWWPVSLRH